MINTFPAALRTSYDVLGKAFLTCLLDIVWRPACIVTSHALSKVLSEVLKLSVSGELNLSLRLFLKGQCIDSIRMLWQRQGYYCCWHMYAWNLSSRH